MHRLICSAAGCQAMVTRDGYCADHQPPPARMCILPGCVSYAVAGEERCQVHRETPLQARRCEDCKGTGWRYVGTSYTKMACDRCTGTGIADKTVHRRPPPRSTREPVDSRGLIRVSEKSNEA